MVDAVSRYSGNEGWGVHVPLGDYAVILVILEMVVNIGGWAVHMHRRDDAHVGHLVFCALGLGYREG